MVHPAAFVLPRRPASNPDLSERVKSERSDLPKWDYRTALPNGSGLNRGKSSQNKRGLMTASEVFTVQASDAAEN
jgi:hypothetical protein